MEFAVLDLVDHLGSFNLVEEIRLILVENLVLEIGITASVGRKYQTGASLLDPAAGAVASSGSGSWPQSVNTFQNTEFPGS